MKWSMNQYSGNLTVQHSASARTAVSCFPAGQNAMRIKNPGEVNLHPEVGAEVCDHVSLPITQRLVTRLLPQR